MRKLILLIAIAVMMMMSPVMALAGDTTAIAGAESNSLGVGIAVSAPTIINKVDPKQGQEQALTNTNTIKVDPTLTNTQGQSQSNTFTPTNTQKQDQKQGQDQGQMNDWSQTYNNAPNYLQAQPIYPYLLQMVPGMAGRVPEGDVPEFYVIRRLKLKKVFTNPNTGEEKVIQEGDKVVRVEPYTRGGRWMGFSRVEDYDQDLLALVPKVMKLFGQKDTTNIRFDVLFKTSQKSIGSNAGGGGSTAGFSGGVNPVAWGSNVAGIGAFAVNTFDPKITLKFYLIKPADQKMSELEYKEQGWVKLEAK